jgi:hypothetical protein
MLRPGNADFTSVSVLHCVIRVDYDTYLVGAFVYANSRPVMITNASEKATKM